jgi:hypothetical protein
MTKRDMGWIILVGAVMAVHYFFFCLVVNNIWFIE